MPALADALGQELFFTDRIGRARHNVGDLLVAWIDGVPVGDVYLWCESPEEPELRERFGDVPILNHLEVMPSWQRRGIGTALIGAAEDAARRRGYDMVMLLVGLDNPDARRLYDRLGYADWDEGAIVTRWTEPDGTGGLREVSLTCDVMTKSVPAPGPDAWNAWQRGHRWLPTSG